MPRAILTSSAALTLLLLTLSGAAARSGEPVLAVLYVANHSGDASYDVLEKGLADMLVTDLTAQRLTVVERTRLQTLIDEQELQRSAFFDPKTAVKVGQGLGASHIVIGALAAMKPEIRLDLHLIDVATAKVVVTAKVSGPSAALFDLEQQLVERFVVAFERRFAASTSPQTRVRDAEALLEYSRALDLADRGELDAARQKIEQAIRLSPSFGLARTRRDELVRRIEASRDRRGELITEHRATLERRVKEALASGAGTPATTRLAWRNLEAELLAASMPALLSDSRFGVAAPGKDGELRGAMHAWAESRSALIRELDLFLASSPEPSWQSRLPEADAKLAQAIELDPRVEVGPSQVRRELASFLLMGELDVARGDRVMIAPPLANLDKTWDARAWQLLAEADGRARGERGEHPQISVLELWGEALLFRGRGDEAVEKWQEILDRFPTSKQFDRYERRIKEVLGLESNSTTRDLQSWGKGLATCDDMSLRIGIETVVYRRMRMLGLEALPAIASEVEGACGNNPAAQRYWSALYTKLALVYGKHGRCGSFEAWMAKALTAGGSASDIAAYRKNFTGCPAPVHP